MKTRQDIRKVLDDLAAKVVAAWKEHEKRPDHGNHPFTCPDVGSVGRCTNSAVYLAERLGGEVYGYSIEDNPEAQVGGAEGGHDFAVIDNRWLADFWAKDSYELPDLYDMSDPVESVEVRRQYGDPAKWARMSDENFAFFKKWLAD